MSFVPTFQSSALSESRRILEFRPITLDEGQILFERAARQRLDHDAQRIRQLAHFDAAAGSGLNETEYLPESLGAHIALHDAQAQPVRAIGCGSGFEPAVERLRVARPIA